MTTECKHLLLVLTTGDTETTLFNASPDHTGVNIELSLPRVPVIWNFKQVTQTGRRWITCGNISKITGLINFATKGIVTVGGTGK